MSMPLIYRIAADFVVIVHCAYAAFVVVTLLAIIVGGLLGWRWIRNPRFRIVHLAMIGIVVIESWAGITCPLTTWEQWLRRKAGVTNYTGDFLANAAHELLFFDAAPWVFTLCYSVFGLAVLATLLAVAPDWSRLRRLN